MPSIMDILLYPHMLSIMTYRQREFTYRVGGFEISEIYAYSVLPFFLSTEKIFSTQYGCCSLQIKPESTSYFTSVSIASVGSGLKLLCYCFIGLAPGLILSQCTTTSESKPDIFLYFQAKTSMFSLIMVTRSSLSDRVRFSLIEMGIGFFLVPILISATLSSVGVLVIQTEYSIGYPSVGPTDLLIRDVDCLPHCYSPRSCSLQELRILLLRLCQTNLLCLHHLLDRLAA